MVLSISTIVVGLGIIFLIMSKHGSNDSLGFPGLLLTIFGILYGFLLAGILIPVKTEVSYCETTSVLRGKANIAVEYDREKIVVSKDISCYNAKDTDLIVKLVKYYNSYGFRIDSEITIVQKDKGTK